MLLIFRLFGWFMLQLFSSLLVSRVQKLRKQHQRCETNLSRLGGKRRRKNLPKTRCFYRIKPISMMRTPHRKCKMWNCWTWFSCGTCRVARVQEPSIWDILASSNLVLVAGIFDFQSCWGREKPVVGNDFWCKNSGFAKKKNTRPTK